MGDLGEERCDAHAGEDDHASVAAVDASYANNVIWRGDGGASASRQCCGVGTRLH
jgi:hypothetical protein